MFPILWQQGGNQHQSGSPFWEIPNNREHPLYLLGNNIDWKRYDRFFDTLFAQKKGRSALPKRLVVGLHYLKHAYNKNDESVVVQLLENLYWRVPRTLMSASMELC